MSGQSWVVNSDFSLEQAKAHIDRLYAQHRYITLQWTTGQQRSGQQNRALHLYCSELAKALNAGGWDMRAVLKPEIEIPWTKHSTKEHIWRPVQEIMTGQASTTQPKRAEYGPIYETVQRHISAKTGVFVPWPDKTTRDL